MTAPPVEFCRQCHLPRVQDQAACARCGTAFASPSSGGLSLEVSGAEVPPHSWPVATAMEIGRLPTSDISVPHRSVSRNHARISPHADGFVIEDLGSMNGTYVNDVQVTARTPLQNGDVVLVGDVALVVHMAAAPAPASATIVQPLAAPADPANTALEAPPHGYVAAVDPLTRIAPVDAVDPGVLPGRPSPATSAPQGARLGVPDAHDAPPRGPAAIGEAHGGGADARATDDAPRSVSAGGLAEAAEQLASRARAFTADLATARWQFEHAGGSAAVDTFVEQVRRVQENPRSARERNTLVEFGPTAARLLQAASVLMHVLAPQPGDAAPAGGLLAASGSAESGSDAGMRDAADSDASGTPAGQPGEAASGASSSVPVRADGWRPPTDNTADLGPLSS